MDFVAWLEGRGGRVNKKLDLFHKLKSGDRGVVATGDIAEGELLLLLPVACTLYIPTDEEYARDPASFPPAVSYLREAAPGLSPFLATTLVLMSEAARSGRAAGADPAQGAPAQGLAAAPEAGACASPWSPYLATLPPRCPDCLLYWSAEEKRELEGTALEETGPEPASDVFRRHVAPLLAARPDLWPHPDGPEQPDQGAQGGGGGGGAAATAGVEEGAAGEGAAACELAGFVRSASLVQSRAFHLEAENWVAGTKQVSQVSGAGTQVFLLPGIDMINHCHDPARRNARLERVVMSGAAAAELLTAEGAAAKGAAAAAEGAAPTAAYFVMRADKPIAAGQEVLHTYGDLSDAQLLQTYGFLDSEDDFCRTEAAGGTAGYRNPYNAALVPWGAVEGVCYGLLRSMDQAPPAPLKRAKRDFLSSCGVLQPARPADTAFVCLAGEPLPPQLLTAVQVLLMTAEEFAELRREWGGGGGGGGAAAGAASGSAGGGGGGARAKLKGKGKARSGGATAAPTAAAPAAAAAGGDGRVVPQLSLGTALLEEDEEFAEMVCIACLQILESCLGRYPGSAQADVRALRGGGCTGRRRLAVRVRLGEREVLGGAKRGVVELMRRLRDGPDADGGEGAAAGPSKRPAGGGGGGGAGGSAKRRRRGVGAASASEERSGDDDDDDEEEEEEEEEEDGEEEAGEGEESTDGEAEAEEADGLLLGSDDSDKVGYGGEEYDDGIGEAHDRGAAHEAPSD